ncbi:Complement C5 Hemolytic complement [Collichthys lucidus]|uniref:Complement C5 Hemolytic complement n=1 Tax=Collichthys lucidus TaxID=240159 RepID=A0A4V6ALV8_COLLU|nr:Complement C5 Hemolytic complement [Collichthys lucidus]
MTESSLTVMEIQLPSGVVPETEDLRQFRDIDEPLISHYELQGNTVVIQMETVPRDNFLSGGQVPRDNFLSGCQVPRDNFLSGCQVPRDNFLSGGQVPRDNFLSGC